MRARIALLLAASFLAGCEEGGGSEDLRKEVGELRADVQRLRKENEKLSSQVAAQVRRIDGLTGDVSRVREIAVDVKSAPAADEPAAGSAAAPSAPATSATGSVDEVAIKRFLSTEEGRKAIDAAIQAEREARDRERTSRTLDALVDRFAQEAALTDTQAARMKEILGRQAEAVRETWSGLRNLGPDATREQREAQRAATVAKTQELRKAADDEVKALLSQTQFETYEKQADRLRAAMRGPGTVQAPGAPAAGGNAGRRNGRRAND